MDQLADCSGREMDLIQGLHHNLHHNFYHTFDHNCGLGVQGKLSRRTWHYQRCAGEAIAAYLALSKGGSQMGGLWVRGIEGSEQIHPTRRVYCQNFHLTPGKNVKISI